MRKQLLYVVCPTMVTVVIFKSAESVFHNTGRGEEIF
jgi:hypothetical protein